MSRARLGLRPNRRTIQRTHAQIPLILVRVTYELCWVYSMLTGRIAFVSCVSLCVCVRVYDSNRRFYYALLLYGE